MRWSISFGGSAVFFLGLAACGTAFSQANATDDAGSDATSLGPSADASFDDVSRDDDAFIIEPPDAKSDGSRDGGEAGAHDGGGDVAVTPVDAGCTLLSCNGQCVPSDVHNCGTCGHSCLNLPHVGGATSCTAGGQCSFPASSCAPGWADCNGNVDDGCETDVTQAGHCGNCSTSCSGGTPVCSSGGCVSGCPASKPTLCNGSCVDVTSDPQNCNGCTKACAGVANGQPQCVNSACTFSCNSNFHVCAGNCADNTSVNSCGTACSPCSVPTANAHATCDGTSCGWACNSGYSLCGGNACSPLADAGSGVFVSVGKSGNCSAGNPCGTIQQGVNAAKAQSKAYVYVAGGTYTEQVTLAAGVTVQGGWADAGAQGFLRGCASFPTVVTIQAPSSVNVTVLAQGGGSAGLDSVTIASKSAANAGESIYGVFVSGGTALTMTDVTVNVVAGGAGTGGGNGSAGANATGTCVSADGANGATGTAGSVAAGSFSASGYTPGNGGSGGTGTAGNNGAAPPPPPCAEGCSTCEPNGDAPGCSAMGSIEVCGTAGKSGCGGAPGTGSGGGTGGGSSIAVYTWGASVVATRGAFSASNGGAGGSGGTAGGGGSPSVGAGGRGAICGNSCKVCALVGTPVGAGSPGGTGGTGGAGGTGGGAAGGYSYSYYQGGGATVSTSGTSLSYGTAGSGGAGGNQGPSGAAGTHN